MSIHPSLKISHADSKARSVLKRTERLRHMEEKGLWKEGDDVYGLPKIKTIRIRIKKEKAEKEETAATAEGATKTADSAKEQAPAKETADKTKEKK